MEALSTLDILYIVLSIFIAIVGTLLSVVLFRLIKILGPVVEMTGYYKQAKAYLSAYKQVPHIVKDKVFELLHSKKSASDDD